VRKRYFAIGLLLTGFVSLGFRVFPGGVVWEITNGTAAETKVFVSYPSASSNLSNDLPAGDILAGTGLVTVAQLMDSIFDDYNNVDASFITLVDTADTDYNATTSADFLIEIEFGNSTGGSSGEAQTEVEDGDIIGCKIIMDTDTVTDAAAFTRTMTHELGHCLGLTHPQETTDAVMSYYSDSDIVRLQIDDKMGVVFLYPSDASAAEEQATFGLGCSR